MSNLKSYLGSVVLAGLLLQGCGSSSDETAQVEDQAAQAATAKRVASYQASTSVFADAADANVSLDSSRSALTLKYMSDYETDAGMKAFIDQLIADNAELTTVAEAAASMATALTTNTNGSSAAPQRGLLSGLTGKVKDAIVKALDNPVGDAITGAAFDVVLNSEGVTVVMLDAARQSNTISEVMVNALEANWGLTGKMCPMLRDNAEFGEKFTALAYERPIIGKFFFERIDARMYGCLTDAMLLSNKDYTEPKKYQIGEVAHSTNAYMGILMNMYAADYFITPDATITDRNRRLNDNFVSLLLDTGANASYTKDANGTITFENHGDGNELTNEKFYYSVFKTPGTTDAFVAAMDQVVPATRTMLMDNIFLGGEVGSQNPDTLQGQLSIIAIGSAMYDGIYGVKNESGTRVNGYGLGSYVNAFIGFAGLIPSDRYITYGKAFVNAGYTYADLHGIAIPDFVASAWDSLTTTENAVTASNAPSRSGGNGIIDSDWKDDIYDLALQAFDNATSDINWSGVLADAFDENASLMDSLTTTTDIAYNTFIDGKNDLNQSVYPTEITNGLLTANDTVYGVHGLLELAIREDMVNTGVVDNMTEAENNFTLPPFADLTMEFAYNSASDVALNYYNNEVNATWLADLSDNELVRTYFYPDANNTYIPATLLAVDWLKVPAAYQATDYNTFDYKFDFNSGYVDIYVTSEDANLNDTIPLGDISAEFNSTITLEKVDMGTDSIIVLDANGELQHPNVYKIRVISPAQVEAVIAALGGYVDNALDYVGIDSSSAATVDTTDANATAAN